MIHEVKNVNELHALATKLYTVSVTGGADSSADSILSNLNLGIANLKVNWRGADAVVRIGEVIDVYNKIVAIRNSLAELASESSKVASVYRERQNANGARLEDLSVLTFDTKSVLGKDDLVDNGELYCNPAAEEGRSLINNAANSMISFHSNSEDIYEDIMNEWVSGPKRDVASETFQEFGSCVNSYVQILQDVSKNIETALQNYNG